MQQREGGHEENESSRIGDHPHSLDTSQTAVFLVTAGGGFLVALTERDRERRGDQLWSQRVWWSEG